MLFCRRTRRNFASWLRSTPERMSQLHRLSFGRISINNSLYRFAATISLPPVGFHLRRSPTRKSTLSILFKRAFAFAIEIAFESISSPITRPAPRYFAARARIPLPVPRSASDQPPFHLRVKHSSKRSDIAVVACSPVPKAAEAGMTSKETHRAGDRAVAIIWSRADDEAPPADTAFEMSNRFPILRGFDLPTSTSRFSQSRGHFSARPPNSSMSFRETVRDVHAISSCSRLRPGLEIITSLPCERACKMFSFVLSQPGSASLRHRCMIFGERARLAYWQSRPRHRELRSHEPPGLWFVRGRGVSETAPKQAREGARPPQKFTWSLNRFEAAPLILFFLRRFFAFHLHHLLGESGGMLFPFDIIDSKSREHVVRI